MMDILDKFIDQAKKNVSEGYYVLPENSMKQKKNRVSLRQKLTKNGFTLITEIKHASPAGEYSFSGIDAEKTAATFKESGADAISVVVEPKIFRGNLSNIPMAAKTGLPVLFKDFVIDRSQIKAAAELGADCILLVVKVADRLNLDLDELIDTAHVFGLEVLLECYDEKEMERAMATKADILGINNRDLQTLHVNLNRTREILNAFGGVSKIDRPVISESGIKSRDDAEFIRNSGVKGILVGTALWLAHDQRAKIAELKLASDGK